MTHRHLPFTVLLVLLTSAASAAGQSLADVARAEEARRKTIKATGKVYTNTQLKNPGDAPLPAPAAAAAASKDAAAKPETPAKAEENPKDEKHWKDRMAALQNAVARNKVLMDALQSRINALTTDFMNRGNPVEREALVQDRKAALAESNRLKLDTDKQNKAIVDLEEEARKANVPSGWLR